MISALSSKRLDSRLVEALPWVLAEYPDLNWPSLLDAVKLRDLQNRLGLITTLARQVAEKRKDSRAVALLRKHEEHLSRSRLLLEDNLCNDSLTQTERNWLKTNRSDEAKFWRVLSDLSPEHLTHMPGNRAIFDPWKSFFRAIDLTLREEVRLHCLVGVQRCQLIMRSIDGDVRWNVQASSLIRSGSI